ncbi:MAG: response regulator transcription factor [Chloroflexi bacterium]|nr:response regulator transcription factor [Chloroflexota bacterium]MCI0577203.1 response regulator transcription factor [Chloroflexota bacterium]MCI0649087.1 response regulator transcription factor [Chloroflexota bacterium]MCI0729696.1 response regulator transcription factor [Chloroflexota bacterium]
MQNILVIDDDELVSRTLQRALKMYGYQVMVANSGTEGLQLGRRHLPDLLVLDVVMPGMDGYQVCRQARGDPLLKDVPILFLTAKSKDEDKIEGFRAGGDDYLAKPFNMDELQLRIKAILRRTAEEMQSKDEGLVQVGDVTLDTRSFKVTTPAGITLLTNVQFDLLYHLMSHAGQVFTSQQLLQDVWDYPRDTGSPELVRAHVKNLRDKLEADPKNPVYIRTIQGHGYTFAVE